MALHRTSLRVAFGLALSVCLAQASGRAQKYPDHPTATVTPENKNSKTMSQPIIQATSSPMVAYAYEYALPVRGHSAANSA